MSDRLLARLPGLLHCLAAGAAAGLVACRAPSSDEREERVADAIHHGRYQEALERAERMAAESPDDAAIQELLRTAQLAHTLDRGRDEVFHGDLTRGLALFEEARALAPEHPTVLAWIAKTRAQLAVQWLDAAAQRTGPELLEEAEACYEKVLEYDPDNAAAIDGLARVLLLQNYRGGMSKTYFDDGLSSFEELQLEQARRAFQVSNRYRQNEPATMRGGQVEQMIAEERLQQAKVLENAGRYFAARNEYRLVLLILPDDAEARAGLDRMDRESRAMTSLGAADMKMRRGEYEEAEEKVGEAELLTEAQKDQVSLLKAGIDDQRLDDMYRSAQSLTRDNRYPDAVAAFEELLAVAPDYKDAEQRKATLEEFIRMAEDFYPKALAATDPKDQEDFLRAIQIVWPEYKDVGDRLRALEARKASAGGGDDGDGLR